MKVIPVVLLVLLAFLAFFMTFLVAPLAVLVLFYVLYSFRSERTAAAQEPDGVDDAKQRWGSAPADEVEADAPESPPARRPRITVTSQRGADEPPADPDADADAAPPTGAASSASSTDGEARP